MLPAQTTGILMPSTTDFAEWLAVCAPETDEDAFSLHYALQGQETGPYRTAKAGDRVMITLDDFTLVLASDKAQAAFANIIEQYNPHPDLGWHGAEVFIRAQSKSD